MQRLAELHRSTPVVASRAPQRGVELAGRASLETALEEVDQPWTGGPFSEPARSKLAAHSEVVCEWLTSFGDLAARVSAATAEPVITHGEPHPGNLIRFDTGLLLVDWDTVGLALPERDLWMLDDGSTESLAPYSDAAGRPVDYTAINLYRLAWTLADIGAFIALFRSEHGRNHGTDKTWKALTDSLEGRPPRPYGPVPTAER